MKKTKRGRPGKFSKQLFDRVVERISEFQPTKDSIRAEGMTPSGFYKALKRCDASGAMKGAFEAAQLHRDRALHQLLLEEAENELHRRALGWEEPVFYKGEVVGSRPRHSDLCLIMTLRSLAPHKYGQSAVVKNTIQNTPSQDKAEQKRRTDDLLREMKKIQDLFLEEGSKGGAQQE